MKLRELFNLLQAVGDKDGISDIKIVGGIPRDKVLGIIKNTISDIDITCGNSLINTLARSFAIELNKYLPVQTKRATDGHTSLFLKNLKIDFSSNFKVPGIKEVLFKLGISNPSDMQEEIYSRDFFCNTLLLSLDLKHIEDLTNQGMKDIHSRLIRTCLSPDLTFKYNTNRIIRVIYLSAKLDFNVDPEIISWILSNPEYISRSENSYLKKNIDKAILFNPDRAIYLINKMNLWDRVPITPSLYPYFTQKTLQDKFNVK